MSNRRYSSEGGSASQNVLRHVVFFLQPDPTRRCTECASEGRETAHKARRRSEKNVSKRPTHFAQLLNFRAAKLYQRPRVLADAPYPHE